MTLGSTSGHQTGFPSINGSFFKKKNRFLLTGRGIGFFRVGPLGASWSFQELPGPACWVIFNENPCLIFKFGPLNHDL